MNLLVIGSGGREHAIASQLSKSSQAEKIFVAPGNGGTGLEFENVELDLTPPFKEVIDFCKTHQIGLAVVGPENFLVDGIVDALEDVVPIFGPSKTAAELENSKIFAKQIMDEAGVKTAPYEVFDDYPSAKAYIENSPVDYVIKADGLCAGKGVIVPETVEESLTAIENFLVHHQFGEAGKKLVIEKKLFGQEVSILGFCDGENVALLTPSQDHKRIFDGDKGPNTGGMGVYTPVKFIGPKEIEEIKEKVFLPILRTMNNRGTPYKGILYAGLMVSEQGDINVIEFNVRFGDPECQCVLPLLQSDLINIMLACTDGKNHSNIRSVDFSLIPAAVCTVILASGGYPGTYETGKMISLPDPLEELPDDIKIFHAGTKSVDGKLMTHGGRVLAVSAIGGAGDNLENMIKKCYTAVEKIKFENCFYRKDIGQKGL